MNKKGVLTIISGFSGAGKGTLVKELVKKYDYKLSISATTRAPREGEEHGREYFFLTREEFQSMIEDNRLLEWAEYVGNYYGTPMSYVEEQLALGNHVILEIEIQGALKVKERCPDALLLFVTPPSAKTLKERLVGRGTEDMETINRRLARAVEEADSMKYYDYLIVNDKLELCVEETNAIIESERNRTGRRQDFIQQISEELKVFKEGE